jgi:hypothetical protein
VPWIPYYSEGATVITPSYAGPQYELPGPLWVPTAMADYFRIGPPWGMVNYLKNPSFEINPMGGNIGNASTGGHNVDAWTPTSGATVTSGHATFHPSYQGFQSMRLVTPSIGDNTIWLTASVPVPSMGVFGFDAFVCTDVPSYSMYLQVRGSGAAYSNTIINDIQVDIPAGTWMRLFTAADMTVATMAFQTSVQAVVRGEGPSGHLYISGVRLAHLPTGMDMMGSYYAVASQQATYTAIDQPGDLGAPFIYFGKRYASWNARWPAHPDWDANQPVGQAVEVGSMIPPGSLETGQGLIEQVFSETNLRDGSELLYERFPNREWTVPFIFQASGNETIRNMHRAAVPTNVIDYRPQGASWVTRFDIMAAQVTQDRDVRYERAQIHRGAIEIKTRPWGYSPTVMSFCVGATSYTGGNVFSFAGSVIGDLPAPLRMHMRLATNMYPRFHQFLAVQGFHPSTQCFAIQPVFYYSSVGSLNASFRHTNWLGGASYTIAMHAGAWASAGQSYMFSALLPTQLSVMGGLARIYLNAGGTDSLRAVNATSTVAIELFNDYNQRTVVVLSRASTQTASIASKMLTQPLYDCGLFGHNQTQPYFTDFPVSENFFARPVPSQGISSAASVLIAVNSFLMVAANPKMFRSAVVASNSLVGNNTYNDLVVDPYSPLAKVSGYDTWQPSSYDYSLDGYLRGDANFVAASGYTLAVLPIWSEEAVYSFQSPPNTFVTNPTVGVRMNLSYMPRWLFVR